MCGDVVGEIELVHAVEGEVDGLFVGAGGIGD